MDRSIELKVPPANADEVSLPQPSSRDDAALVRPGKRPVLKRSFGFLSILGFSCTVLVTWEDSLITFLSGLQKLIGFVVAGLPASSTASLVVWVGTLSVFTTLAELVSMAPTSGGQYHWVSMLAPPSSRRFLGYLTGWLSVTGWKALVASGALLAGTEIQGLILLTHPDYADHMQNWHGTLLFWAVALLCLGINASFASLLARFEGLVLILHLLGFFAVLFPLALLSEHGPSSAVFQTWLNLGGWDSQGLSFCVGLSGCVYAFLGGDCAIHMSEEIENAAVVIPQSLLTGLTINGSLGFTTMVVTLYSMGDIDAAVAENPYSFMSIFRHATGSTTGAAVMSAIVVVMTFSATTGVVASTSRIYWAFSRDRGLPSWKLWKQVDQRTSIPRNAVLLTTGVAIILSLVNIGDQTAFNGLRPYCSTAGLQETFGSETWMTVSRIPWGKA
ncbi:hypothetical protein PG994_013521 [Apiospora phragmitis]|uniref:Amino acid transporter n=1 Tax=Apiospora phragmitis TaxID=2905665 RepID=A0ABR1TBF4_9PEZI